MRYSGTNRPIRRFLSIKQMRQLLDVIPLESPFGRRDYLLIMLLYHTGLRVGELSQLTVSYVLNRKSEVRDFLDLPAILCKGPRGRVVPLNTTAQACVSKLIKFNRSRGLSVGPDAPLFQNRFHRPLSVRSMQLLIKSYREKADLDIKATPHTFRHTNATVLQNAGVPTRVIQQGLGHRYLSTTERYLGVQAVDFRSYYERIG